MNEPWPESQKAKLRLSSKVDVNTEPVTPQSVVDQIAASMDDNDPSNHQYNHPNIENRSQQCGNHYKYSNDNKHLKSRELNAPELSKSHNSMNSDESINLNVSPENMSQKMIQQYINQNGGIVLNNNSNNKIILG